MYFHKLFFTFFLFLLLNPGSVLAQIDTNSLKYFPLNIGNKWIYSVFVSNPPLTFTTRLEITKDTVILGRRYFYLPGAEFISGWFRIDSVSGNIYKFTNSGCTRTPNEMFMDSLRSKLNDTMYHCGTGIPNQRICIDTAAYILSSQQYSSKKMKDQYEIYGTTRKFSKNLGITSAVTGDIYSYTYSLRGCVINGAVYGDTSLTSITQINENIPESYLLYQNYPNPFNPNTKIKFQVPKLEYVSLIIYDATGRKVTSLINEKLMPGIYEINWDGTNFTSGVYFCNITAGDFIESRKMLLIK